MKQGHPHYARTNGELSSWVPCIVSRRMFYENIENTTIQSRCCQIY